MSRAGTGLTWREQRSIRKYRRVRRWRLDHRRSLEEGVLGGSPNWLAIGVLTRGAWILRQAWRREAELVYRTQLKPGQSLVIRSSRPAK